MRNFILLSVIIATLIGCQSKYPGIPETYHVLLDSALVKAGDNSIELIKALTDAPKEQKEGMAFLISYMPLRDLTTLNADFLLENSEYAYKAREKYSWCAALPDSIFFNEVLPYANISETRDPWRKDFYERFAKYVEDKDNLADAIFAIARPIKDEVNVEYNTKRSKVDSSPKEAMAENMATCTGLSILLTDAFRSVGIPSRLAGNAMWTNYKGNHTWSEVWIDNEWKFIEYYPDTLNKSWFVADAGKADPTNPYHWIYAVSYKPTGQYYYAGVEAIHLMKTMDKEDFPKQMWPRLERMKSHVSKSEPYIWGHNVTQKYIDLYQQSLKDKKIAEDELMAGFVVFKDKNTEKSESRLNCRVEVYRGDKRIDFGYSPSKTDDMNQLLNFRLKKNTEYKILVSNTKNEVNKDFTITTNSEDVDEFKLILEE